MEGQKTYRDTPRTAIDESLTFHHGNSEKEKGRGKFRRGSRKSGENEPYCSGDKKREVY